MVILGNPTLFQATFQLLRKGPEHLALRGTEKCFYQPVPQLWGFQQKWLICVDMC
jgi:hypothetical protein